MVGIEERAAQPRGGDRHLHSPEGAFAGVGVAGAEEHLEEGGSQHRAAQPAPPVPAAAGGGAGQQAGRRRGPAQDGGAAGGGSHGQPRRAGGGAQQRHGLIVQPGLAGRDQPDQRLRPGQRLQAAQQGDGGERRRRQRHRPQVGGAVDRRHRQGESAEGEHLQAGLAPAGDPAKRQWRPQQQDRQQRGERHTRMAYHGATVPRNLEATAGLLGETMRLLTRTLSGVLPFFVAMSAGAQFTQYTTPGGPDGRPVDRKGELAKEVAAARLRLGPVRVAPEVSLKDVQYVKNLLGAGTVGAAPSDVTATASAGFRAYLPTGPDVTWTAYALPEYVWWQKQTELRRINGLYGLGLDSFWNRLTLQLRGGSEAQQQILTAELPRLTSARTDHVNGTAEVTLTGAISAFVTGSLLRQRALGDPLQDPAVALLAELDRDEAVERAGLHWRPGNWLVGVAAEHSQVTFADRVPGAVNRSNAGTAPVLELSREHGRLFFQADVAQRSLSAIQGSQFVKFDKTTGHITVSYELARNLELFGYVNRNLVYSVEPGYSYFDDLRHGLSLHMKLGHRTRASVFGETGTLGYTTFAADTPNRHDDLTAYGGSIGFQVFRGVVFDLQGSHTRFTSNLPGFGRTLNVLGFTLTLAAGQPPGAVAP